MNSRERYSVIEFEEMPVDEKGVAEVVLKVGDAVFNFDPGYASNDVVTSAVVEDIFVSNTIKASKAEIKLKNSDGTFTLANADHLSVIPWPWSWMYRSWINREYAKYVGSKKEA